MEPAVQHALGSADVRSDNSDAGCGEQGFHGSPRSWECNTGVGGTDLMGATMRIAIGGFMHESNTFAPLPTDRRPVREGSLTRGDAIARRLARGPPRDGRVHRGRRPVRLRARPDRDGLGHARRAGRRRRSSTRSCDGIVDGLPRGRRPTACCWPCTGRWSRRSTPTPTARCCAASAPRSAEGLPIAGVARLPRQRLARDGRERRRPGRLPDLPARRPAPARARSPPS